MNFQVDTNIAPPTKQRPGNSKYPWEQLEVGHSFFADVWKDITVGADRRENEMHAVGSEGGPLRDRIV